MSTATPEPNEPSIEDYLEEPAAQQDSPQDVVDTATVEGDED